MYTKCSILNNALRFLKNYGRYGKMFQTKVTWFGEGHKKVLIDFDLTLSSHQFFLNETPYFSRI